MKKRIYLSLLAVIAVFFSCKDDSGKFEEQLFTNDQISHALIQCIDSTIIKTLNTLCVVDTINEKYGYYHYDEESYRLNLPTAANNVVDTLIQYGYGEAIDTLILDINRAAERCGNRIKQFWNEIIKEITFPNPNLILRGNNNAITNFVKETRQNAFRNVLVSSILVEQFNASHIVPRWNELQRTYFEITGTYSSIDILVPVVQQMMDGFFRKMALEEEAIRLNPELRGPVNGWLYRVFEVL